jgi:hypothetical protein
MLRLAKLLKLIVTLSISSVAWAEVCPATSPITLHRDDPVDLRVFFDRKHAAGTPLQLYAGDKRVRTVLADKDGRVRLGVLREGRYRVVLPRKEGLDIIVLPQSSGINGPVISWFLFPESKYKWFAGKEVPGRPCDFVMLRED